MPLSQNEILHRAELLASNLAGESVKKNSFLSVVSDFMLKPNSTISELRRMLSLLMQGSGGHLKRGGGYGDQVRSVVQELGRLLDRENLSPVEFKSIFGWTARLLSIRMSRTDQTRERSRSVPFGPEKGRQANRISSMGTPKIGSIGSKSLEALKNLREHLEKKKDSGD